MIKNYVIDTNVLLSNADALFHFEDNNVIIPIGVIEELDRFKKDVTELGRNARQTSRLLDELREKGDLKAGVETKTGGKISVRYNGNLNSFYKEQNVDLHVIHIAQETMKNEPEILCIIVSRDTNVRIRANALGIKAENYEKDRVHKDEINKGYSDIDLSNKNFDELISDKEIDISKCIDPNMTFPNYYFIIKKNGDKKTVLGRVNKEKTMIKRLMPFSTKLPIAPKNKEQNFLFDALLDRDIKLVAVAGKAGSGKAQPLSSLVLTPSGYKKMGDISIGDMVSTPDGRSSRVLSIHPQGTIDTYKVTFSDGTSTICSKDHLWLTKTSLDRDYKRNGSVKTTEEIANTLLYRNYKKNHSIGITNPVEFDVKNPYKISGYVLGVMLGDGCFRGNTPIISSSDKEIINECEKEAEVFGIKLKYKGQYDYTFSSNETGEVKRRIIATSLKDKNTCVCFKSPKDAISRGYERSGMWKAYTGRSRQYNGFKWEYLDADKKSNNPIKNELMKMELYGVSSSEKFIPFEYKFSDIKTRIALLNGLMDTDGYVAKGGCISYSSTSKRLCEDIQFIVESLGGICTMTSKMPFYRDRKGNKVICKKAYTVFINIGNNIPLFKLKRKINRCEKKTRYFPIRYITNVELVGKEKCQCIYIESNDHLYMTNNCIVTHNTLVSIGLASYMTMVEKNYKRMLVSRPVYPMGKDIGFLPGEVNDKLDPWMTPIYDAFDVINDNKSSGREYVKNHSSIIVEPLTYIRGRSIHDQILIVDEAQNLSTLELKTIISRAGENTKIILTGDIQQIDNPYIDSLSNGLSMVIAAFRDSPIATSLVLERCVRSELAEEAADRL